MDPNATLQNLITALHEKERDEVQDCLEDLVQWIEKGGFLPDPSLLREYV